MKYRLILWDFDGTLADTLSLALDVYNRLAADRGFRPVTDPHAVRDMSMREFLSSHNIPAYRVPFVFSAFLSELRTLAADVQLNRGIVDALKGIAEAGVRQGIVSSNSTENIRLCLKANGADHYFDTITGTSGLFGKGKRIRTAIRELAADADEVLYAGDEIRDIEAASAAGLDIVSVGWGLNSPQALRARKPTYFAARPSEILEILHGSDNSAHA